MATITLKNVPKHLHARLKALAKKHKRSLNQEAMVCIELATGTERPHSQQFLAQVRKLRERIAAAGTRPQTQRFVRRALDEGRA
jgi:plasmid stability protein